MVKDSEKIKAILEDAFGKDSNGQPLVNEHSFRMEENDEEIAYDVIEGIRIHGNTGNVISSDGYVKGKVSKSVTVVKNFSKNHEGKKAFLFFLFEGKPEYIFSVEIIDYADTNTSTVTLCKEKDLSGVTEDVKRVMGTKSYYYIVAIKIGSVNNRNYDVLKHYLVSSDNRTYNRIVRNMVEYIFVKNEQKVPENKPELPHNLLVSGAPGTGKSHYLEASVLKAGGVSRDNGKKWEIQDISLVKGMINGDSESEFGNTEDEKIDNAVKVYLDTYLTRVTFYEDYTYENFVGCYKPIPKKGKADISYDGKYGSIEEEKITYEYVPGPFTETYIKAKNDPEHSYYLIIEEINRAKAASVFGDIFQLMDRKNGVSEYDIKPESALDKYLKTELECKYNGTMKLPPNMYLWATMNSADQGVLPLDSAFKRRWAQIYMDINPDETKARGAVLSLHASNGIKNILWENLRTEINDVILANGFDEDRCIGSWYFSDEEIQQINNYFQKDPADRRNLINPLIDKLFSYLRLDVFRRNPGRMFKAETDTKPGITMSDLRRRVMQGQSIDSVLKVELKWLPNEAAQSEQNTVPQNNEADGNTDDSVENQNTALDQDSDGEKANN